MFKSIHSKLTLLHAVTFGMLLISFALILYFSINSILGNTFDKIMLNAARSLEYSIFMPTGKKRAMDRIRDELLKSMSKEDVEFATRFMPKIEGFMKKVSIQDRLNHRVERVFFFKPVYVQIREIKQEEKGLPAVIARSESMENRTIPLSAETYASLLKGGVVFGVERWEPGERFRLVALLINDEDNRSFVLQLGMPSKEVRNMVRRLGFFNLVLVPVLLIIAAVGGYFFVRRAFRPVRRIVKTVNNITSEDLSLRIEEQVLKDEIGELIDTFNNMIGRLQKSFQAIKEFAGNASHELKTPLTVIRGEIEVALRKDRDSAEYKTILASVQGATSDLQLIIDDLLFLARMDSETVSFSFKELDLEELILATHEENYAMAEKKKITVILDRIDSVRIKGNRTLLSRLFSNLMRNAINYSGEDGQIRLTLSETEEGTAFVISDTGIGIPAEALPRIFDSFYRVDESHSPGTGGAGLGLAIVKRIVEFHKGVIEVESELGKGTEFTIRFPAAGSA